MLIFSSDQPPILPNPSTASISVPPVVPHRRLVLGRPLPNTAIPQQPVAQAGRERVLGSTDRDLLEEYEQSFKDDFVDFTVGAIISGEDKTISPWLQRVGWAKHFSGLDSKVLASHRGKMPDSEYKLCQAAMKKLFQQSEVLVMSRATHLMKRIIRSPHTATPLPRPFHLDLQDKTRHNYQRVFFDITVYLLYVRGNQETHPCFPLCNMSEEQWVLLDSVAQVLSSTETDEVPTSLLDTLQQLWVSLLCLPLPGDSFDSPLIHCLAVLGYDSKRKVFKQPNNYTHLLAAVLFNSRVLLLSHLLRNSPQLSPQEVLDDVRRIHSLYLADGSASPVGEVMNQLAMGMDIVRNTQGGTTAFLSEDKKSIILCGNPVEIEDIRLLVHMSLEEGYRLLEEKLFISREKVEGVDLGLLKDKLLADSMAGHSLVTESTDLDNAYILKLLLEGKSSYQEYLQQDPTTGRWRVSELGLHKLEKANEELLEVLFVLMHLCGGPPGRGTEMEGLRKWNVAELLRNIFVLDGKVFFATFYHKSQHKNGTQRAVARFLPTPVAQLLISYLVWISPLLHYLRKQMPVQEQMPDGSLLWVPTASKKPWNTSKFSKILTVCPTGSAPISCSFPLGFSLIMQFCHGRSLIMQFCHLLSLIMQFCHLLSLIIQFCHLLSLTIQCLCLG
jgi:hypothetical protein